ncbi:hypothetical protein G7054_g10692 [Neopestalotiopsis clavispora]|nr:hypothetical protein G7054_g10692 [Neopestalotiopsis clavispora]
MPLSNFKRRVAVIGAGPAGAITTDALVKEQCFDTIRVFERQDVAGGTWVLSSDPAPRIPSLRDLLEQRADDPVTIPSQFPCKAPRIDDPSRRYTDTAAHENLYSNLPPDIMGFTQEPIPAVISDHDCAQWGPDAPFRHREVMRQWVEDIFTRGNHTNLVSYGTAVELAEYVDDEWVLTLRKGSSCDDKEATDFWWQERFDAVVVATGHYYLPHIPKIPGMLEYDAKFPGRIQHSKHFRNVEDFRDKKVVVVGGSVSAFDALHDMRKAAKLPVLSAIRNAEGPYGDAPFLHPQIDNRSQIASFEPELGRVNFADGSSADDVDVVLFATGYDFSFPFLPGVKSVNNRIPGLYQHVFKSDNPSLAFVGMVTGGFGIRIFEWQAVAVARVLAGRADLPPQEWMEEWDAYRVATRGDGGAFWTLAPDFEDCFETYRAIAGDPARGTLGRVLPRYDPAWAATFWNFVKARIERWEEDAKLAKIGQIDGTNDKI